MQKKYSADLKGLNQDILRVYEFLNLEKDRGMD